MYVMIGKEEFCHYLFYPNFNVLLHLWICFWTICFLLLSRYHSQLEGGRVPIYAFTFQEPENDPRNCCYLWAVQSAQDQ